MNNKIVLTALQSQLATKQAELESHETSVVNPALQAINQEVLQSLRENVSPLIPGIRIDAQSLGIKRFDQPSYSSVTVYLESDWRSEDRTLYAKINWYGSSATLKDENTINDVIVFGAVAAKLAWIEYEFVNNWNAKIIEIGNISKGLHNEISEISRSIRSAESQIREEEISVYKQEGFECTITPALTIERNWEKEGSTEYELRETVANMQLSTGRSKWDYVYVKAFKVLKTNKYKTTLSVTPSNDTVREYTVSAKSFDEFILHVYNWQSNGAKINNDKMTERLKSYNK